MVTCPECRKKISETSDICPYCNHWFYQGEIAKIRNKNQRSIQIGLGLTLFILVIIGFYFGNGSKNKENISTSKNKNSNYTSTSNSNVNQTIGYKLAVIDKNGYVDENDLIVKRYTSMVKQLDFKYTEDSVQIADMTVSGRNQLIKFGIEQSMIEVMQGINTLFDPYSKNKHYSDYVSMYIILRSKGLDNIQSFDKLQLLLNSMSMGQIKKSIGVE